MRTLYETVGRLSTSQAKSLLKWLKIAGIREWGDVSRLSLHEFRDTLAGSVSPNTAKWLCASLKSVLNRYSDELTLPPGWERILTARGERPRRAFLTARELRSFEAVAPRTAAEAVVKAESLLEAYTGARVSDIMRLTSDNVTGDTLVYTSMKTSVTAAVPVSERARGWIAYAQTHRGDEPTLMGRNKAIRAMLRRAGVDSPVKVFQGGAERTGPKWMFISSHSFRVSFCTNLAAAGCPMIDISRMAGHSSPSMTARYVQDYKISLPARALAYFS